VPRFVELQSNFSTGELDPLLRARVDLQAYNNALAKATNVLIQPQGGLKRRPGTKYILELPNSGASSAGNGVRLVPFQFSVDDSYMLCFTHNRMYIIKNGVVQTNINGSGNNYLTTSIGSSIVDDMCWTQSADTLIVVHPDLQPVQIQRTSDTAWTATTITFDSIPKYAFNIDFHTNNGSTLTPSAVSGNITLTASTTHHDSGAAQAGSTSTITLKSTASATDDVYNGMYVTITSGTGSGQIRLIEDYVGSTKVATVAEAWTTAPDATSNYSITTWTTQSVNQYVNASPQGRARILRYVSATVVEAVTEYPFFNISAIDAGRWELEHGYVDVWSSDKGWPRTVTFHEGRLYFGGSKSRPSTIWGSKIGLFYDFVPTENLDDDALEATLDTNDLNVITDIISGRDFQVFTTGGEFYVPQQGSDPITPLTFTFKNVSKNGIKPGTRVQALESGSVYIQRQGKSLNEFVFNDTQLTYITQRISLLSGHLLKGPQRIAMRRATSTEEGDLLLITNTDDGSMAAFSVMRSQQITAPSEYITTGDFIDVGIDVTDIYTVTRRIAAADLLLESGSHLLTEDGEPMLLEHGGPKYFVELFDDNLYTDCAVTGGAASGASGLPMINEIVNVICDGVPQGDEEVSAAGTVTFDRASVYTYEVGLPFTVYCKTMPAEIQLQTGSRISFKKRIVEINAIVSETQELVINDQPVAFRLMDNPLLDEPVPTFTGIKRVNGVLGYDREQAIEIEQTLPLKMTLLGLDYRIAVYSGT
jgi:hypothetical protein